VSDSGGWPDWLGWVVVTWFCFTAVMVSVIFGVGIGHKQTLKDQTKQQTEAKK